MIFYEKSSYEVQDWKKNDHLSHSFYVLLIGFQTKYIFNTVDDENKKYNLVDLKII